MFQRGGPSIFELAQQALSSTREGYDLLGEKFEKTPFRTPDSLLEQVSRHVGTVNTAMDLCCGTGAGVRMLRPHCREVVTGVDFSQGMLDAAAKLLADAPGSAALHLEQGDAFDLSYDAEFDVVTCFGALGHVLPKDEPAFFDGIRRALKPGGRYLFITTPMPPRWHPAWWLSKGFNAAMHARNAVVDPPFVMFYLTQTWPDVGRRLAEAGLSARVVPNALEGTWRGFLLVEATRPATRA